MYAQLWDKGDRVVAVAALHREHSILDSHWQFPDPTEGGTGAPELSARIEVMSALLVSHFWNEEELMRTVGFPGYEDHKAEHRRIVDAFEELLTSIPASAPRWSKAFVFLREWEANHRVTHDRVLGAFVKRSAASDGQPI